MLIGEGNRKHRVNVVARAADRKRGHCTVLIDSSALALRCHGCRGDLWAGLCAPEAGDCGRSLRNRDAGDSDARHVGDGHLEQ